MPLNDAVGINCEKGTTTEYQGSSIANTWAERRMLDKSACVVWLNVTTPPTWREKVKAYSYYIFLKKKLRI